MITKAAKTLSVAVVAMGALTAVVVTGWIVNAQDSQQQLSINAQESQPQQPGSVPVDLNTFAGCLQQGTQLEAAGDYEAAIALFQRAKQIDAHDGAANREIGNCLTAQGKYSEALGYYQQALAANKKARGDGASWYGCAVCYKELGDLTKVQETVQELRKISLLSPWTIKAMGIQAEMEGQPAAEVQTMMARETAAADLCRQGENLMNDSHVKREMKARSSEILQLFDQVLSDYPETGVAFSAMVQKAELLWHIGKLEEMCAVYKTLRASPLWQHQPDPNKAQFMNRTIDSRMGQHQTEQLLSITIEDRAAGNPVPQEKWDRIAVLWDQWRNNADGANRMKADLFRMYILCAQRQFQAVAAKGGEFFLEYNNKENMLHPAYKDCFAGAHLTVGYALRNLKRYDEAIVHFKAVIELSAVKPPLLNEQTTVPAAYADICRTMKEMGAPRADVLQEIDACLSRYPDSTYVQLLKKLRDSQW